MIKKFNQDILDLFHLVILNDGYMTLDPPYYDWSCTVTAIKAARLPGDPEAFTMKQIMELVGAKNYCKIVNDTPLHTIGVMVFYGTRSKEVPSPRFFIYEQLVKHLSK